MTSAAFITRLPASARRRSPPNLSAINTSLRWPDSGNCSRRLWRMAHDQDTVRILYKKLLSLYPRAFKEQMGASMVQTFDDLCSERKRQTDRGLFGFVLWMFMETSAGIVKENFSEIKRGGVMENVISNNKSAAIIGLLLATPLGALLLTTIY